MSKKQDEELKAAGDTPAEPEENVAPTSNEALKARLNQVADVLEQEKASGAHQHVRHSKMATAGGPGSLREAQKPGGPITNDAIKRIWDMSSPLGESGCSITGAWPSGGSVQGRSSTASPCFQRAIISGSQWAQASAQVGSRPYLAANRSR
jgi:hypothetical protein